MINSYHTLKALAERWNRDLPGCIVGDVYCQSRDELTLAFVAPDASWMIRASTRPPLMYLFRTGGYNKARRNVATLFRDTFDLAVTAVRIADRDRLVYIDLDDGSCFQIMLFGPRANVLFVDAAGVVRDAFQHQKTLLGRPAPSPAPAPVVGTFEAFESRWRTDRATTVRAVASAMPLLNAMVAQEIYTRAGVTAETPATCTEKDRRRLFEEAIEVQGELEHPSPRIYWADDRVVDFSLISLSMYAPLREESFDDIDEALAVFIRRKLAQQAYDQVYAPLEKALRTARDQYQRQVEAMLTSLAEESRADRYERWGHLLMASQAGIPPGAETVELADLFEENRHVHIPVDSGLNRVENAQKYYEKARQTRQARAHAEERLFLIERRGILAQELLQHVQSLKSRAEVAQFKKNYADQLAPFLGQQADETVQQTPFRRFVLDGGYEVWVGKNARQNDELTFGHARKFDFWLHARGVPGSHTVLRLPGRTAQPDKRVREQAAAIAAYYSKARGSHLVPVIMTERKYVRKARGREQGAVIVEKEDVLIVEPGLPN